jgi:hypothetical protein
MQLLIAEFDIIPPTKIPNDEHNNWILNLSKRLFDNGVQVILDRYELKPGSNMMHFMEQSIPKADKANPALNLC